MNSFVPRMPSKSHTLSAKPTQPRWSFGNFAQPPFVVGGAENFEDMSLQLADYHNSLISAGTVSLHLIANFKFELCDVIYFPYLDNKFDAFQRFQ